MTASSPSRTTGSTWRPRPEVELLCDQVAAIEAWTSARRAAQAADGGSAAQLSREERLDRARRDEVDARAHEALLERTRVHLQAAGSLLRGTQPPRAVVVHRDAWFADRLCGSLQQHGVDVLLVLENGAEAIGAAVAEQPDLLLVEDRLPMVSGAQVLRAALPYCARTTAVGQAQSEATVPELLDAGAAGAWTRRVAPADLGRELAALVRP